MGAFVRAEGPRAKDRVRVRGFWFAAALIKFRSLLAFRLALFLLDPIASSRHSRSSSVVSFLDLDRPTCRSTDLQPRFSIGHPPTSDRHGIAPGKRHRLDAIFHNLGLQPSRRDPLRRKASRDLPLDRFPDFFLGTVDRPILCLWKFCASAFSGRPLGLHSGRFPFVEPCRSG